MFQETANTLGSWTVHFTASQPLMGNMIFSCSLSRTSCQGNLELRQETRFEGGLWSMQWGRLKILAKATGRQPGWMAGWDGWSGLREGSHSFSCTAWEGVVVDWQLTWDQARGEGLVSAYLDSGRCPLLPWGKGQMPRL